MSTFGTSAPSGSDQQSGSPAQSRSESSTPQAGSSQAEASRPAVNVGESERMVSVAAGTLAALMGLGRRSIPGLVLAGIGGALIYRGVTGHCSTYESLGINTADEGS